MIDIDRLIGFMAIMQVPFMNDPDALMYIEEVKTVLKQAKEKEPIEAIMKKGRYFTTPRCGRCEKAFPTGMKPKFCPECGTEVKWNER